MRRLGAALAALVAAGATWGVWAQLRVDPQQWRALSVRGQVIGVEKVDDVHTDAGWRVRREATLALEDGVRTLVTELDVDHDGVTPQGEVLLDLWAPTLQPGARVRREVLDPYASKAIEMDVVRDGDTVTASGKGVTVVLDLVAGSVVRTRRGPLESVPVDVPPDLAPFDPRWFEVPVAPMAGARSAREAVFRLDGREVVVQSPMTLEVPPDFVDRAAGWNQEARARGGDCQAQSDWVAERARGAGYAASVREGWVYREDADGAALVPHAWVDVRVGEAQVAVDPALDAPVGSAARLLAPRGEDWFAAHRVELVSVR